MRAAGKCRRGGSERLRRKAQRGEARDVAPEAQSRVRYARVALQSERRICDATSSRIFFPPFTERTPVSGYDSTAPIRLAPRAPTQKASAPARISEAAPAARQSASCRHKSAAFAAAARLLSPPFIISPSARPQNASRIFIYRDRRQGLAARQNMEPRRSLH